MTASDLLALLPLLLVAATSVIVMLAAAVHRNHVLALVLTLLGLAGAFCSVFFVHLRQVTALLIIDSYALFFMGLIVAASFAVALLAYGYLASREGNREEFYVLILVATLGAMVLAASTHFVSFFLGLEILSVALYALISYLHGRPLPVEAGIKYLVLAAASAAFLLFGIALIYATLGTMEFARVAQILATSVDFEPNDVIARCGPDHHRHRLQAGARTVPHVDPRRLRGRSRSGDSLRRDGFEGRHVRTTPALLPSSRGSHRCPHFFSVLDYSRRIHVCRQSAGALAK